ncbi:MAG TPA: TonB family protein [Candidatus Dormibacteraeota bacterium]|nr:TonB family protein [Candidatus Dormibacteraeota bacterium]
MIPRILVPLDARPPVADSDVSARRRPTTLDQRSLVPAMLPIVVLDGHSTIPANLPLESIATRVVVPRDLNPEAYGVREKNSLPLQPTEMDERVTVPQGSALPLEIQPLKHLSEELVELDVFMTGEVQLMPVARAEKRSTEEWFRLISSIALHALLILALLVGPKIFPAHVPTAAEEEIARRQVTIMFPFRDPGPSAPSHPLAPSERVHVDPRVLRKVAPPAPEPVPVPAPQPERSIRELPSAPVPQPNAVQPTPQPSAPTPKTEMSKPQIKLEAPDTPQPQKGLVLPKQTTRSAIEDSLRSATKNGNAGGRSGVVVGPMPKTQGTPGVPGSGGQGGGSFGNGYEILTPTEGVDFSDYMQRLLASVRRNWYAVMPESAQLGDQGRVLLQFRIMRNGNVPGEEPNQLLSSGKEPLDRAAISAIRSSNPFQPLPPAFSGPYIELRIMFLYNLPIEAANQ